jgi:hypothetical protein
VVRDDDAPAGAPDTRVGDAALKALLLQADHADDAPLRHLVLSYITLRKVTADMVAFLERREGGATVVGTPVLMRARELSTRLS